MSKKRYEIKIIENAEEIRTSGKDWREGANPENGTSGFGYTPEIQKTVSISREVFSYDTDSMDLKKVIAAAVGLER